MKIKSHFQHHRIPTPEQWWLWTHGGRTILDVFRDNYGKYVLMWDGKEHTYVRIYIPIELHETN